MGQVSGGTGAGCGHGTLCGPAPAPPCLSAATPLLKRLLPCPTPLHLHLQFDKQQAGLAGLAFDEGGLMTGPLANQHADKPTCDRLPRDPLCTLTAQSRAPVSMRPTACCAALLLTMRPYRIAFQGGGLACRPLRPNQTFTTPSHHACNALNTINTLPTTPSPQHPHHRRHRSRLAAGTFGVFGYVTEGMEALGRVEPGDVVRSARVVSGADKLVLP